MTHDVTVPGGAAAGDRAGGVRQGLRAVGVVKRYAGVPALAGVDLQVDPGQVVGLVGHNGAGKSTLLKAISGAVAPDEGLVTVDGVPVPRGGPAAALAAGISTVYQELSLLENLTVVQNAFLGRELRRGGNLQTTAMRARARDLVERFGVDVDVDRRVGSYPVATRQLLEIAVATSRDARYLLLDEPTTALEGGQVDRLLEVIRSLAADGLGLLLVDHKLDELYAVADRVVALVDGRVRIDADARTVDRAAVVRAIAGEEAHVVPGGERSRTGEVVGGDPERVLADATTEPEAPASLVVRDLHGPGLHGVSLAARPGRVLGLYGLIGSGRTELLRTLVGLTSPTAGSVELHGRPHRPRGPAQAQRAGVAYLTEERKVDGIVPGLDATMNVVLPVLHGHRRLGFLDRRAMARTGAGVMDRLSVRGDRAAPVVSLSGGNQQKVLLGRVLAQGASVLLLDEPTKGVDIGVKSEIHRLLRSLAHEEGLTVVVVSSEEDEVLEVSDDVAVFVAGRCDGELLAAAEVTPAALRHAAWQAA